jgi:hypothetical protein
MIRIAAGGVDHHPVEGQVHGIQGAAVTGTENSPAPAMSRTGSEGGHRELQHPV